MKIRDIVPLTRNTAYTEKNGIRLMDFVIGRSPGYTYVEFDVNSWDAATITELGLVSYTTGETAC